MPEPLELVRIASSETRRQILRLLQQGFDHPEDLAKKLKIRRTSVDKQLVELFGWGLVDRAAIFPPTGRPRIIYQVTQRTGLIVVYAALALLITAIALLAARRTAR